VRLEGTIRRLLQGVLSGARYGCALTAAVVVVLVAGVPAARASVDAPAHGRAWEIVTPAGSGGVGAVGAMVGTDRGGDRVLYFTWGPGPGAPAGSLFSYALSTRGTQGWDAKQIGFPYTTETWNLGGPSVHAASPDLSTLIWGASIPLTPDAPTDLSSVYRSLPNGGLTRLGSFANDGLINFYETSDDGRHVPFQTTQQLLPADAGRASGFGVYEFAGDELRLASVDSGGAPLSSCGARLGFDVNIPVAPNAVSSDGERIFMSSPDEICEAETRRVYLRSGGTTTVEASASRCTRADCNAAQDVTFMGATPSGSAAFLATAQQLTDDDADGTVDLYRFDVAGAQLTRLSAGPADAVADVVPNGVLTSDDGSRVYFLARGALVPGSGVDGEPNLYLLDGGELRYVTTLSSFDDWPQLIAAGGEVTPDGEQLLLTTIAPLTPQDGDDSTDVYRYDAISGQTTLVSIGSAGGNGDLDATVALGPFGLRGIAAHSLSSDGRRAFFETSEKLLPEDTDGTIDVYEWLDGELGLVSSGGGDDRVAYEGASADGRSVFFSTSESLVGRDRDGGELDLYTARVGGGFADPAPPPPGCEQQGSCPDPPANRVSRTAPASLTAAERRSLRLHVAPLGPAARDRIAARGRMSLIVRTPVAGTVSARVRARIGGRPRTVATGRARAIRSGALRLRLRLSRTARGALRRGNRLGLRIVLRHARLDEPTVLRVVVARGTR
jgi:hypothetical protein